ncbi:MAG: ABC transporter ATP-binding protein [Candidatus Hodarchaeota archaeon]
MSQKSVILETRNLTKYYGKKETTVPALVDVSMRLYIGEPTSIMGPSGSGKTTLLNLIGLLDKPTSGEIIIDGKDITRLNEKEIVELRRYSMGFVFQFYNLIGVLTALENVELPMLIAGVSKDDRKRRAEDLLETIGLKERANHLPDELSGGEQQRVAVARALANNPSIILADEPTGDLDSKSGKKVVQLMANLCRNRSIGMIMVTHDEAMSRLTDRIILLQDGKIVGEKRPNQED